jgi:hypothetical protein
MFEAWNSRLWNNVSGVLLWMTHPAWPSTDWQVYSWDYETLGFYFGAKKACEPIHIQMNLHDKKVLVINTSLKNYNLLNAALELFDLSVEKLNGKSKIIKVLANQLTYCFTDELTPTLPAVYLVRLTISDGKKVLSQNEYWRSALQGGSFDSFNHLAETRLTDKVVKHENDKVSFVVSNPTKSTVIGLKFNLRDPKSGNIILPAYFSDGYFTIFPGEKKQMEVKWNSFDQKNAEIVVEGYNLKSQLLFVTEYKLKEKHLKEIDQAVNYGKQYGLHVCINFLRYVGEFELWQSC